MKRSHIYKALRIYNDINAIARGKGGRRLMRRLAGRYTGRGLGRLFR